MRHLVMGLLRSFAASASLAYVTACATGTPESGGPVLDKLLPRGCQIRQHFTGTRDELRLACPHFERVVASPHDLEGLVAIGSPEEALAYLRYFSSRSVLGVVKNSGVVEVVRESDPLRPRFASVPDALYDQLAFAPTITQIDDKLSGMPQFEVSRTVVMADSNVYRLRELVTAHGGWEVLGRDRLGDVTDFGIVYHVRF